MHGKLLALKVYSGSNEESGGGKKKRRKNAGGGAQNSRRKANQQSRNFIERYGEKRKKVLLGGVCVELPQLLLPLIVDCRSVPPSHRGLPDAEGRSVGIGIVQVIDLRDLS